MSDLTAKLVEHYRNDSTSVRSAGAQSWMHPDIAARFASPSPGLARARVLGLEPVCGRCGRPATDAGPGEVWRVLDAGARSLLCPLCFDVRHGDSTAARSFDDDPPADWLGLAVWCGVSLATIGLVVLCTWAAKSAGWL